MASKPKLTQARVNKLSKNPGTRSKVPTAMLSPKLQAMRKSNAATKAKNAVLDDPAALTAPLTPRTLGQQVQSSTDLAYGSAEQDLAGQQRQAQTVAVSIPAWFQQYQDAQAAATQATRDATASAVAQQQNATSSTYGLDKANADQVGATTAATAASAGGAADPAIAAQAQQAALSRRSAGDAQTRLTAGLGASQVSYRAGQETVGAAQKLRAQLDQQGRQNDLGAKSRQLAKDKGNYAATARQKLIDAEHTKQIENKAFNLNVTKAEQDAAAKSASLAEKTSVDAARLGQGAASLGIQQQNADTATQRANDANNPKLQPKRTPAEKTLDRNSKSDIDHAVTLIKQLQGAKVPVQVPKKDSKGNVVPGEFVDSKNPDGSPVTKPAKLTSAQIRARLIGPAHGKPIPKDIVNAAYDIVVNGHLTPANVRALHKLGISINALGYPTGPVKKTAGAGAGSGAGTALRPKKKP